MPLTVEVPPRGIEKVLDAAVSELLGHGALAVGTDSDLLVGAPLRVYHLGADALAARQGLAAARSVGWIALLSSEGETLGSLELLPVEKARRGSRTTADVRFGGFTQGPLQRSLALAIAGAIRDAGRRARIQASILRVPALHLLALWLRETGVDKLLPVAPAPSPLEPGTLYEADRALSSLAEAAEAALAGRDTRN